MKRIVLSTTVTAGLVLACAAGCGSQWSQQHNHNTPIGGYIKPKNVVIEYPYGFDNVARACVNGDGVYVAPEGKTPTVVANDPACRGGQ